jgi:hypothetical protein
MSASSCCSACYQAPAKCARHFHGGDQDTLVLARRVTRRLPSQLDTSNRFARRPAIEARAARLIPSDITQEFWTNANSPRECLWIVAKRREYKAMTRLFVFASVLIASGTPVLLGTGRAPSGEGIEVPPREAARICGGQCGSYQQFAGGACTNTGSDSCTSGNSNCSGVCPYTCAPTTTYSGSGTFTGSLIAIHCNDAIQGACTETICSVAGAPVACCQCLNASDVTCGPAPIELDSEGCSGT